MLGQKTTASRTDGGTVVLFLPARNEVCTVADLLRRTPGHIECGGVTHPVRTVVVDDGSSDGTGDLARATGATVIRTPGLGLGAAVRIGLDDAVQSGAIAVAFCDADGEYDPADLADLVEPIIAGRADYVVGSRFAGGPRHMRLHRNLGNRLLTVALRSATRSRRDVALTDGQSGYRALSRAAASAADIAHDYNYAQVLTLDLLGKRFRYDEVAITYAHRRIGRSFVRLPTYLRQVLPAAWRVRRSWRPATREDPSAQIAQVLG